MAKFRKAAFFLVAVSTPLAAWAAPVTLVGNALNSCILTVSVGGIMVADSAATTMRSDTGTGARPATLLVAALGAAPTLTFAAPTLTGPSGFTPDSVQFSYTVNGSGASRGFASTGATASSNLIDTVSINGLVTSATGFPTGTYTETVNVTCG